MRAWIDRKDKIFVAGHRGLVGRALVKRLNDHGYQNILTRTRSELDLLDSSSVENFFHTESPQVVIVAAAKVGGILANNTERAEFIYQNLQIQNNIIWAAHQHNTRRLVFLGSSCIYPRDAGQPMVENALLTGPLEYSNRPYAIAKIAGLELVHAIRKQYHKDFFSVMPTNLYGPGDNFDLATSHVLPALIRKFEEASRLGLEEVSIWGSGDVKREFLHSEDCADAIIHLCENVPPGFFEDDSRFSGQLSHINIGSGYDMTIRELAALIKDVCQYSGRLAFDRSKPDGTPRKLLNVDIVQSLGWTPKIPLSTGIRLTLEWYKKHCL